MRVRRDVPPAELFRDSVSSLSGVTDAVMGALGQLRIQTVFDLATSDVFANALQVVTVADPSTVEAALALLPGDTLNAGARARDC